MRTLLQARSPPVQQSRGSAWPQAWIAASVAAALGAMVGGGVWLVVWVAGDGATPLSVLVLLLLLVLMPALAGVGIVALVQQWSQQGPGPPAAETDGSLDTVSELPPEHNDIRGEPSWH
ncbi:hypothetical protein [Rhizobacter sp. OV335]|jgi:hypothetical protein|uniref:hypothetical protein n=1 Tax=Rhizobacter sp. OV335 TaxID=1500264 RepID=UPI00091150EF|nr:hypothetical protein [Rhizobacter sp. OV335]SHM50680.1 hypothetical protein SAMN02787076_01432 [Rhizobacter sp. OV335]